MDQGERYLADDEDDSEKARTLRPLHRGSCVYRIAFGPRARHKVLTLQGALPREASGKQHPCANLEAFSVPLRGVELKLQSSFESVFPASLRWSTTIAMVILATHTIFWASSRISMAHTWVVRPTCTGVHLPVTQPLVTARK